MKNVIKIVLKVCTFLMLGLMLSCEKELVVEKNPTTKKLKPLPNIEVNSKTFDSNDLVIVGLKQKFKSKFKSYRTLNSTEQLTLEGEFGKVNLNSGVEIIDSLGTKTTTYEVLEATPNVNSYYNFVVKNTGDYYLYKIERTTETVNNIPANSTVITSFRLNSNLSIGDPCPKVFFPPFGDYVVETIVTNPTPVVGGGGGGITIGNINNPSGGFPSFGGGVGGFGGGGSSSGGSSGAGSSGGSSSGGSGSSGGGGSDNVSLVALQLEDFFTEVWNWITNLFGGCKCPKRMAEGHSTEEDLTASHRGLVLSIEPADGDCPQGFVYVIIQDAYVDKINSFEGYFTYLHNNDKVFLYNNHNIVDYLDTVIQTNNSNSNLMQLLPTLINNLRHNKIDWYFFNWATNFLIENPEITCEEFDNWFIGKNPKTDGEDTINPDLITFDPPLMASILPTYQSFLSAFPKKGTNGVYNEMPANEVYTLVGGTLLTSYNTDLTGSYSNACSIRGSRGILYSNIEIPILKYNGSQRTQKGGDNKNYILDAVSFNTFMKAKFGEAQKVITGLDANNPKKVAEFLKGKNGIYVIINNDASSSGAGYSGHVTTIMNGICIGKAYTNPTGGVKSIRIWTLN